jgi:hypothetical protein
LASIRIHFFSISLGFAEYVLIIEFLKIQAAGPAGPASSAASLWEIPQDVNTQ